VTTPTGIELVNRAIGAVEACDNEFLGVLGASLSRFSTTLRRLRGA